MTQAKHTPGTWSIELGRNGWDDNASIIGADGSFVAQVQWTNDSQQGNARLIAAAPDLFSVLKMVQEAAIDMRGEDFNLTTEQWAVFHSAIAKATGSTQ